MMPCIDFSSKGPLQDARVNLGYSCLCRPLAAATANAMDIEYEYITHDTSVAKDFEIIWKYVMVPRLPALEAIKRGSIQ